MTDHLRKRLYPRGIRVWGRLVHEKHGGPRMLN